MYTEIIKKIERLKFTNSNEFIEAVNGLNDNITCYKADKHAADFIVNLENNTTLGVVIVDDDIIIGRLLEVKDKE